MGGAQSCGQNRRSQLSRNLACRNVGMSRQGYVQGCAGHTQEHIGTEPRATPSTQSLPPPRPALSLPPPFTPVVVTLRVASRGWSPF